MNNKLEIIETVDYIFAVSDAEIKERDCYVFKDTVFTLKYGDKLGPNCNKIIAYQPKGNAKELDLPLLPDEVVEDDVEKLAFSKAPNDTQDDPAYPNFSDTDIFVFGFKEGYKAATKVYSEEGLRNIIKWLNKNYSKIEDELAKPIEDNRLEFTDTFFNDVYEEALTRAINYNKQSKTPAHFLLERIDNNKCIGRYLFE